MPRGRKKGSNNKPKTVMAANPTNPANSANQVSKTNTKAVVNVAKGATNDEVDDNDDEVDVDVDVNADSQ